MHSCGHPHHDGPSGRPDDHRHEDGHHGHHHVGQHHHHGQAHGHHHHFGHANHGNNRQGLIIALAITTFVMHAELIGGWLTNSLALISDAGHMLSDAAALGLSLVAIWLSSRPATAQKTYGFHRFEILAALFNGFALFAIAGMVVWEAIRRFAEPPEVAGFGMLLVASVGLIANVSSAWALMRKGDVKNNLNLRSAYLHVLGDALGSIGAIAAGVLMTVCGWYWADPVVSILVSLLILRSAWHVIAYAVHVLMEGAPAGIERAQIAEALLAIEGVQDVHDLHVWTITSGFDSLSCHIRIADHLDSQQILRQAIRTIEERFHLAHLTIQVETAQIEHGTLCH